VIFSLTIHRKTAIQNIWNTNCTQKCVTQKIVYRERQNSLHTLLSWQWVATCKFPVFLCKHSTSQLHWYTLHRIQNFS